MGVHLMSLDMESSDGQSEGPDVPAAICPAAEGAAGKGSPRVLGGHKCQAKEPGLPPEGKVGVGGQGTEEFKIVKQPVQICVVERPLRAKSHEQGGQKDRE